MPMNSIKLKTHVVHTHGSSFLIFKLPARLQYWNEHLGECGLREDASIDVSLPPILTDFPNCVEELKKVQRQQLALGVSANKEDVFWGTNANVNTNALLPVTAKSWRIIVSCVGRVSSTYVLAFYMIRYAF